MRKIVIAAVVIVVAAAVFISFITHSRNSAVSLESRLSKPRLLVKNQNLKEAKESYRLIIDEFKESEEVVIALSELADIYHAEGQLLKAKQIYTDIIHRYSKDAAAVDIQDKLWNLNIEILFSGLIADDSTVYEVKAGDTINKIARKFKTTVELIKKSNSIKNSAIRPNDRLKVATATFSIVVDKSQNTLTLKAGNEVIKIYSVSTGKDNCTPTGNFTIVTKLKDPVHFQPGKIIPAESPENVLGSRWMGISIKTYGIHGTTEEGSIGQQITKGCVRMTNEEVEELYDIVAKGTEVTIVD
ncbi:MAG: L,D-transpeptidase family protein [Candidatus Omnitrophica bacterium]|nr:L,D-transpeptidase family protein [Candidatus Omnitrophota bacterium]